MSLRKTVTESDLKYSAEACNKLREGNIMRAPVPTLATIIAFLLDIKFRNQSASGELVAQIDNFQKERADDVDDV